MRKLFSTITSYRHRITLRTFLLAEGFGFLFSLALVLGFCLDHFHTVTGSAAMILLELLAAILLAEPICFLNLVILFQSDTWKKSEKKCEFAPGKVFVFYLLILTLAYLPVFLAYYPSIFSYDAERQMYEVVTGDYSTHHPLLHTIFMGMFFKWGAELGSFSLGMAIHSVVQMLLMNSMMAYALMYLYKAGTKRWLRVGLAVLWAVLPTFSILSISTTKDVLFSGLALVFMLKLHAMYQTMESDKSPSWFDRILFIIIVILMMLLRNNAVYAYVVALPLLFVWMRPVLKKSFAVTALAALVLALLCSSGLKAAMHAQNGSPREMLSIPIQQLARVGAEHYDELTPEIKGQLNQLIEPDWYDLYKPHLADPIKERIHFDNPGLFVKTWLKLLPKYPGTYIDAFLDTCEGQWYLFDVSHSEIYGKGKIYGFGYLSTDMRHMPAGMEIETDSKLPALYDFMESIVSDNAYQKIPVVRLLFAPALYVYLMLLYIMVQWYRRDTKALAPAAFLLTYYLTLLLSPAVLVRYLYLYMLCVPVLCLLYGQKDEIRIE